MNDSIKFLLCLGFGFLLGWVIRTNNINQKNVIVVEQDLTISMENLMGFVMRDLENRKGEDLDKSFKKYTKAQLWGEMNLAGIAMDNSQNPEIKDFASQILIENSKILNEKE